MPEQNHSAFAAMRALRDELRAKALDEALRQLEPRTMNEAVDLALTPISDLAVSGTGDVPKLPNVDGDDVLLNFRGRASS